MSLAGRQMNPIDANFLLQETLKNFDKKSVDKIWPKKDNGWKVPSFMPIRINKIFNSQYMTKIWSKKDTKSALLHAN